MTIWDDDGFFEFLNAEQSQSEGWADNYLSVRWTGAANRVASVDYVSESLTAKAWTDFEGVSGTLIFWPGDTLKPIFFRGIEDTLVELDEQALFRLRNPSANARLGAQSSLLFTILDNDTRLGPGRGANWSVVTIVAQPDGRILASGCYNAFNGVPRNTVVRLNSDGSLDAAFNPNANGWGDGLAVQPDGKIIIGGQFGQVGGVNRGSIARLNPNGALDTSFLTDPGANGWVETVALQTDGKVLIGGWFSQVNGAFRNHLARLETNGTLDVSFVIADGPNAVVRAVAVQPNGPVNKVLIGGDFSTVAGFSFGHLARLQPDGSVDPSFSSSSGANGNVYAILPQPDGKILIAGEFTAYNGAPRTRVARLTADGLLDPGFDAGPLATWTVLALALQTDGKILIGGGFYGDSAKIARLNADGSLDNTFQSPALSMDEWVVAIAVLPDNRIAIGGYFTSLRGVPRNRFAILNSDGSLAPDGSETAPPVIRVAPADLTTSAATPPHFSVTADGSGPLTYQWRRNGVAIPGATGSVLNFGLFPEPVARWSFTRDLLDSVSGIPVTLKNGAVLKGGRLVFNGQGGYGVSGRLPFTLREKTIEAWVTVQNPTLHNDLVGIQLPGATLNDDVFDALVLGEMQPQRWIAGSDYWRRTQFLGGPLESGSSTQLLHMVAIYGADHRITLYRNGAPYGASYKSVGDHGSPREFPADLSQVVFGLRTDKAGNGFLKGSIDEVRLYDRALSAEEAMRSFTTGPSTLPPDLGPGPTLADGGNYDVIVSNGYGSVASPVAQVTFLPSNLAWIPPGSFTMGSPSNEIGHTGGR